MRRGDVVERERFDVAIRRFVFAGPLPDRGVAEVRVVALGLAVGGDVFLAEVRPTGFVTRQRVPAHGLGQLEVVADAARRLERLVEDQNKAAEEPAEESGEDDSVDVESMDTDDLLSLLQQKYGKDGDA